jgi:UDP-N-acetylmuramoylalanine--D-glutamate ligase
VSRVVVMGLGRFGGGAAVARWFAERGHDVLVTDLREEEALADSIESLSGCAVAFRLGRHDPADFAAAEFVVVNPAVPFDHPLLAGKRVVTELGIAVRELKGPVVAITGTNGKSTTATLVTSMLEASGVPAALGGNIGRSLLNDAASLSADTVAVLEVSSFQLAWLEHADLRPRAAVVTNVTGDHLDRHPDLAHYVESKRKMARFVPDGGTLVLPRDDPVASRFAEATRAPVAWFSADEPPAGVDLSGLRLLGRHNRANAAAAAHAALAAGATPEGCAMGAAACAPLPHRLESLGERDGVLCVNDSVCTTPHAAAAAVASFDRPVVLLTGGRDKGLDPAPLIEAASRARAVVAYGETGPKIARFLPSARCEPDFASAVRRGLELARKGEVLLLSPGFASYDEFPGFDIRGARFRELVGTPIAESREATR